MSTPPARLREGKGPLAAALRAASAHLLPEDFARERIWRRLQAPAPRVGRVVLAALSAAAAIAVLVNLRQKPPALRVIDGVAQADASSVRAGSWALVEAGGVRAALGPGAVLLLQDGALRLESGMAAFSVASRSRVAAAAAWVNASSASFVAEVQARRATVRAGQGAVEVEWQGRRIPLAPGQAFLSDGASDAKASAAAQGLQDLVAAPPEQRARQVARLSEAIAREAQDESSADARAGNALYQFAQQRLRMGQPAAALQAVADYRARFPEGTLAQEAALTAIEARVALSQNEAAVQEIDGFLSRWPSSERAAEVRRLRETLLHRQARPR